MWVCRENLERLRIQRDDETVEMKGFKGFSNKFGKRKRQLKVTVDEATCGVMDEGFGGASEQQKVQPLGILRQCHVGRC